MDAWPVILVLGSLLGLIAAALVRKAAGKGDLAAPAMRKCPHCATLLRDDVPLCRSSLNVVPLASASESRSRVSSRPARATGGQRRARERLRPGAIVAPTGRRESGQPGARRRGASEIPSVSDPPAKTRPPQWPGIAAFVALTFVCAWASTLLVDRAWDGLRGVFPTRLLAVSAHYWLTMGWPPLLAAGSSSWGGWRRCPCPPWRR
jgi:hypothetical protein